MKFFALAAVAALAALSVQGIDPVVGQSARDTSPLQVIDGVIACRAVAVAAERLACYDAAAVALAKAQDAKEIAIVSRADVREARRGLFGFSTPRIRLFSGRKDGPDDEEISEIASTITAYRMGPSGYVFTLADGAVWAQTEGDFLREPKNSQEIKIKRGAFGSYFARVQGGRAVRVKRRE